MQAPRCHGRQCRGALAGRDLAVGKLLVDLGFAVVRQRAGHLDQRRLALGQVKPALGFPFVGPVGDLAAHGGAAQHHVVVGLARLYGAVDVQVAGADKNRAAGIDPARAVDDAIGVVSRCSSARPRRAAGRDAQVAQNPLLVVAVMHRVERLGRAADRLADGGRGQHEVLARRDQDFLAVQARRVGRVFGIDRDAASRVVQVDGAELVVEPAVDAHFGGAHLVFTQVGRGAVSRRRDHGDVGVPRRQPRHIGVLDRQRRQRLRSTAAARVNAVDAEAGGFGGGVERADVAGAGQVGAVVLGKAAVGIDHHVVDPQVQRAAVFNVDFGVGTRHQRGGAGHVVAEQLDVSAARAQVQDVQEVGRNPVGGHDHLAAVVHRHFYGQAFLEERGEIKAQFSLDKGFHLRHIAITRQLVVQPLDVSAGRSGQVFVGDGVANVAFTFQNLPIEADHQPLFVAKASLERAVQHGRVAQGFPRAAVVAADAHELAQLAGPVADLALAFNYQRAFDAAQLDGAAGTDCGGIDQQRVVQVERGVGMGVNGNRYRRVVEQVDAGGDEMLVAVEVAVLPGQQAEVFGAGKRSAGAQGDPVVDIGRGVGIALGRSGQAIGFRHRVGLDVDVGQRIDRRFAVHVDAGVLADGCVGVGVAGDAGVDHGNRDGAADVHLGARRAAHLVVGAQFQQVFQQDAGVVADAGGGIAVEFGMHVGASAAEHAAAAAFGALRRQVGACQVVGGQDAQAAAVQRRAVKQPGRGRAIERGAGDRAGRAHRRRVDGGGRTVVAHQSAGFDRGHAADHQLLAGRDAQVGRHGLVVVDRGLCAGTRHDAARAGDSVAVDGLVAAGLELQAAAHIAPNAGGTDLDRGVADSAGKRHAQADKASPDADGFGLDAHRVGGGDARIPGAGEHGALRQLHLGNALVGRGRRSAGGPKQQRTRASCGQAGDGRVAGAQNGRELHGVALERQRAQTGDRHV